MLKKSHISAIKQRILSKERFFIEKNLKIFKMPIDMLIFPLYN